MLGGAERGHKPRHLHAAADRRRDPNRHRINRASDQLRHDPNQLSRYLLTN
jgi:hypothetical protein